MEKQKLKLSPWLVLLIVALLLIVLHKFFKEQYKNKVEENMKRLKDQIQTDFKNLKTAQSLKIKLERKAEILFKRIYASSIILYILTNYLLIASGISFMDAIEGSGIIVGLSMTSISVILFNRIDFNALLEKIQKNVILYVYRKHGFSQSIITELRRDIITKKEELLVLEYELNQMD